MEILKIKEWKEQRNQQFKMIAPHIALRTMGRTTFYSANYLNKFEDSFIWYKGRKGVLLEFFSDCIHVQIEIIKPGVKISPGVEFDNDNFEEISVPINNIDRR